MSFPVEKRNYHGGKSNLGEYQMDGAKSELLSTIQELEELFKSGDWTEIADRRHEIVALADAIYMHE